MKVWILESGVYDDRYVSGVFDSPESAMAYWEALHPRHRPKWKFERDSWTNQYDWEAAALIFPEEVRSLNAATDMKKQP